MACSFDDHLYGQTLFQVLCRTGVPPSKVAPERGMTKQRKVRVFCHTVPPDPDAAICGSGYRGFGAKREQVQVMEPAVTRHQDTVGHQVEFDLIRSDRCSRAAKGEQVHGRASRWPVSRGIHDGLDLTTRFHNPDDPWIRMPGKPDRQS